MFNNRIYRQQHQKKGLVSFDITVNQTNLNIQAQSDLSQIAIKSVLECRNYIENYIDLYPEFATALKPLNPSGILPSVIREMIQAGIKANVGPMASVAGIIAQTAGESLGKFSSEIVVENGGDIFIKSDTDTVFGIYAKDSPFFMTTGIEVKKRSTPYGICTSSGTLGHSKSFGTADAATVLAASCPLADAVATALGNRVLSPDHIKSAIDWGKSIDGVEGMVIIKGQHIGLWGDLELVRLEY